MKPGSRASLAIKIACSACPGPLPDQRCARYQWPSRPPVTFASELRPERAVPVASAR